MSLRSTSFFGGVALICFALMGCGGHHDHDDYRTANSDGGTAPQPRPGTDPRTESDGGGGRPTSSSTGTSSSARCAPGAACNGVQYCYDSEYVVEGNGTCTLDCDCIATGGGVSSAGVGTLVCQIGSCR